MKHGVLPRHLCHPTSLFHHIQILIYTLRKCGVFHDYWTPWVIIVKLLNELVETDEILQIPYLPYHLGKTFSTDASNGPNVHPQINHKVKKSPKVYSPGSMPIMEPPSQ